MIHNRTELAKLFTGVGAELGVAGGHYSSAILAHSRCTLLWSVDRWSDHHDLHEYMSAAQMLAGRWKGRAIPLRMTFEEAAPLFDDGSLSFIYIDGYAREGQEGGQTLARWWPKLKQGGIFAGHDYHADFPRTIQTVDDFAAHHGLTIQLTGEIKYPSWYTTKA